MARTELVEILINSAPDGAFSIIDLNDGWPSKITLNLTEGSLPFAIHASQVGSHARGIHEFRFQNPGSRKPVEEGEVGFPVLLGVWLQDGNEPIFVGVDGTSRVGRIARFSILFNGSILDAAKNTGWSTYVSATGEQITAFSGSLAPAFFEALSGSDGDSDELHEIVTEVQHAISDEITASNTDYIAPERARLLATRIARSGGFGRKVYKADGFKCALCGICGPMIQAAHINPVSAPGSNDFVENGITLCANHHHLFDSHNMAIQPNTNLVVFSPEIEAIALQNAPLQHLISQTVSPLPARAIGGGQYSNEMLAFRLQYYSSKYDWLN